MGKISMKLHLFPECGFLFLVIYFPLISMSFPAPELNISSHLSLLWILYTEYLWYKYTKKIIKSKTLMNSLPLYQIKVQIIQGLKLSRFYIFKTDSHIVKPAYVPQSIFNFDFPRGVSSLSFLFNWHIYNFPNFLVDSSKKIIFISTLLIKISPNHTFKFMSMRIDLKMAFPEVVASYQSQFFYTNSSIWESRIMWLVLHSTEVQLWYLKEMNLRKQPS